MPGGPEIEALKALAAHGQSWADWSTLIVFLGLLGEIAIAFAYTKDKPRSEIIWGIVCGVVIAAGVYGEYRYGSKAARANLELQRISELMVANLNREAGEAIERAANVEKELASAKKDAAVARKDAEGFQLQIASANARASEAERTTEAERLATARIEERLSGWQLTLEAQEHLREKLLPFAKTPYDLAVNPSEFRFMRILDVLLGDAGWVWHPPKPPPPFNGVVIEALFGDRASVDFDVGIKVQIAASAEIRFEKAATALILGLRAEGIPAKGNRLLNPDADASAIHIIVGRRQ